MRVIIRITCGDSHWLVPGAAMVGPHSMGRRCGLLAGVAGQTGYSRRPAQVIVVAVLGWRGGDGQGCHAGGRVGGRLHRLSR